MASNVNLNQDDCYQPILADAEDLAVWAINTAKKEFEEGRWALRYGFISCRLEPSVVFELCPVLKKISDVAEIIKFGVTKMTPNQYYQLHKDTDRGVSINMMLEQQDAICAFADVENKETVKLDYESNKLYLFNTQVPHTVLNFTGDRYLFTTRFADPIELLPYRHLQKQLRKIQLL